jgi:hypothetical protein
VALNGAATAVVGLDAAARRALWAALPGQVGLAAAAGAALAFAQGAALSLLGRRLPATGQAALARGRAMTFWPFGLAVLCGLGVLPDVGPQTQLVLFGLSTLALGLWAARRQAPVAEGAAGRGLAGLFFGSGAAALIYQVVWQRTLGTSYGTNIESATMVVSVFMLGLGLGSLLGGHLSARFARHAAPLFLAIEVGIGVFGVASLWLIRAVAAATLEAPFAVISAAVVAVLLVPTLLMGATLPILVAHVNRAYGHVGLSVAHLYALNALGSALACFVTGDTLFPWLGQSGAVLVAAGCNFVVGALVFRFIRQGQEVAG